MVVRGIFVRGPVVRGPVVRGMVVRGPVVRGMVVRACSLSSGLDGSIIGARFGARAANVSACAVI
jgi:hypothetical protein